MNRLTVSDLRDKYRDGEARISMLTAYDFPTARILDKCEVDVILVGDSVGTNVLGYDSEASVTLADMIHHTAAVARGTARSFVLADLPKGTVDDPELAVSSAKALVAAGADGVKIEVDGENRLASIRAVVACGIPVCSHVGYTPQSGGLKAEVQGKSIGRAMEILSLSIESERAGAFMIVIELVPEELADHISLTINIPTIGIGSGRYTTGQVQVFHDIAGISEKTFRHTRRFAEIGAATAEAVSVYVKAVELKKFPTHENAAHIDDEMKTALTIATMEFFSK